MIVGGGATPNYGFQIFGHTTPTVPVFEVLPQASAASSITNIRGKLYINNTETIDNSRNITAGTISSGKITANGGAVYSETTQGAAKGTIHLDPDSGTDHAGTALTFGASDSGGGNSAHAGIYTRSDGSYGTKMYLSTTDSYATGSKTAIKIDQAGHVGIIRGNLTVASNVTSTLDLVSNRDIAMNRSGVTPALTVNNYTGFRLVTNIANGSQTSTVGVNTGGVFYTNTGFAVNTTTVIDSSRNLTNIGTISSGAITVQAFSP